MKQIVNKVYQLCYQGEHNEKEKITAVGLMAVLYVGSFGIILFYS